VTIAVLEMEGFYQLRTALIKLKNLASSFAIKSAKKQPKVDIMIKLNLMLSITNACEINATL